MALTAQVNGTAVLTYDDTNGNRKTSGVGGLGFYDDLGNVAAIDNFLIDDLVVASALPPPTTIVTRAAVQRAALY